MSAIDPQVLATVRPFSVYAELGKQRVEIGAALRGPLGWLLTVACFVAWTTSGALLPEHILFSPIAWAFVPVIQAGWVVLVARRIAGARPADSLFLYYRGHFPWLGLLMAIAAGCLFVPDPWPLFRFLLASGIVPALVLAAMIWCGVLTYAMFRAGLGLTRRQSAIATIAHYVGCIVLFSSWFLLTGQLLPLWGIM